MPEKIDVDAARYEDHNKMAVKAMKEKLEKIHLGGGEKRIAEHVHR